ncbi:MAG TPA: site-specific integrase [Kofleriaceae bacterium]
MQLFEAFAGRTANAHTGAAVEAWRDALAAQGLSPRTVNTKIAAVKFAAKRYEALGHGVDFARAVEFLPVVKTKKRFARPLSEAARLLEACHGPRPCDLRDFAMFTLGFRTGLRRESLAALRFEDIDGRKVTVVIKGGRIHELYVDDEVIAAMAPWIAFLKRRGIVTGQLFRSLRPSIRSPGVVVGAQLHPSSINSIMNMRCEQVGLKLHPHLMRHSCISWLLDAGASVFRVQQLTGHRDPASIQEYAYDTRAVVDPIGGMLPSLTSSPTR